MVRAWQAYHWGLIVPATPAPLPPISLKQPDTSPCLQCSLPCLATISLSRSSRASGGTCCLGRACPRMPCLQRSPSLHRVAGRAGSQWLLFHSRRRPGTPLPHGSRGAGKHPAWTCTCHCWTGCGHSLSAYVPQSHMCTCSSCACVQSCAACSLLTVASAREIGS